MPTKKTTKAKEVKAPKANKVKEVSVFDLKGNLIRKYSEQEHGETFMALAKSFSDKNNYKLN